MAGRNRHASLPISYLVQGTSPVILCTTKYYSSTTKYYSVLQSATPVLQSIAPVLQKYYSVLQSSTPVLFRTTLYYKVLQNTIPQNYSVLESATKYYSVLETLTWNVIDIARSNRCHPPTSPNTVPATKSHCHDWSSSRMKRYLQRAEQQKSSSNITKYCACHEKSLPWLILVTYDTSDGILPLHPPSVWGYHIILHA